MTRARSIAVALAVLGATCAVPAAAQYTVNENRGPYVGGSLGINDNEESAWRILGGYQVNRSFAVELGYHDLGQQNIAGFPVDSTAWELAGVGRIPINERFAGYGKLGAYRAKIRGGGADETAHDLTFGAGLEYAVSRQTSVRGEWQRYRDMGGGVIPQVADVDVFSLGVVYRFR